MKHEANALPVPRACRAIGIDPDLPALGRHRGLYHGLAAVGEAMPFRAESFDLVSANMVFEHLEDPGATVRECYRISRPGGTLLIHTPNAAGYSTLLARLVPEALKPVLARMLQGRHEDDVYRANSARRLRRYARSAWFSEYEIERVESSAQLSTILPLIPFELSWIRVLRVDVLAPLRVVLLARFTK